MHKALKGTGIVGLIAVIGFALLFVTIMPVVAVDTVEVRSTVANVMINQVTWGNSNFAGFYYDRTYAVEAFDNE